MNKPDRTNEGGTTIDNSTPGIAPVAILLKTGTAMKLGKQAVGVISYQILTDSARTEPMIKITANDGGGYVSKEVVPFRNVEACIAHQEKDQAFPSKLFQAAFTFFLLLSHVRNSPDPARIFADVLRYEELDYGFYY